MGAWKCVSQGAWLMWNRETVHIARCLSYPFFYSWEGWLSNRLVVFVVFIQKTWLPRQLEQCAIEKYTWRLRFPSGTESVISDGWNPRECILKTTAKIGTIKWRYNRGDWSMEHIRLPWRMGGGKCYESFWRQGWHRAGIWWERCCPLNRRMFWLQPGHCRFLVWM